MKKCIIVNGNASFVLKVDGEEILFSSFTAAEYFKAHYTLLGYVVLKENW